MGTLDAAIITLSVLGYAALLPWAYTLYKRRAAKAKDLAIEYTRNYLRRYGDDQSEGDTDQLLKIIEQYAGTRLSWWLQSEKKRNSLFTDLISSTDEKPSSD